MKHKTGAKIYAHRKMKGLTQEQLAEVLGVSGVSVSKWERGISIPDIDLMCKLADYFEITLDELLGRAEGVVDVKSEYTEEEIVTLELGQKLIEYCKISRDKGILAMESAIEEDKADEFLCFTIKFWLDGIQRGTDNEFLFVLLENYANQEELKQRAFMVLNAIKAIVAGENEECLKEIIASYLGRKYRDKFIERSNISYNREEVLGRYTNKKSTCNLLETIVDCGDREVQIILKNIDNDTLIKALYGASGRVCQKFLQNVSDRMLRLLDEDINQFCGIEKEIFNAQKKILEIAVWLDIVAVQ